MKHKLPKGFTLIELLIVIAIIAVLSVIGAVIYGGVQKGSRDSRRISDINAIANAMEAKYGSVSGSAGVYAALDRTFFTSGVIPVDPLNGNNSCANGTAGSTKCHYCYRQNNPTGGAAPAGPITAAQLALCLDGDPDVAAGLPAGGTAKPYWVVCTNLEAPASGTSGTYFYCRQNQQ